MGCLTAPVFITSSQNIHEMCPAERLPFTPSHPFLIPPRHLDLQSFTPQRKRKKSVWAISFFGPQVFSILHVRRAVQWPPRRICTPQPDTAQHSKTASPPLEVRDGKCSHCLVEDTQWDRVTWRKTNGIVQDIYPPLYPPTPSPWNIMEHVSAKATTDLLSVAQIMSFCLDQSNYISKQITFIHNESK